MIAWVVVAVMLIFLLAYRYYGRFLVRQVGIDDGRPTPAVRVNDGVDYIPTRSGLLLGQHFSAIAAAGPIVGPVLAGLAYGWLPTLLWIICGAVFVGGVHDFTSLVASVRHGATSIGEIVKEHVSRTSFVLFLAFVWLCLVYVIVAFTDVTAQTFCAVSGGEAYGPGVAASSVLYLASGFVMGILLYKFKAPLGLTTAIFVPLVLFIVWLGPNLPQPWLDALASISGKQWDAILLAYCFVASVIPMWLLLQPRGYLGGWLLYLVVAVGLVGALSGQFGIRYDAVVDQGPGGLLGGALPMMPFLFTTVACGACSGFHSVVSSGTTSKQLARESDARRVGYGAMLLEGLVAVLALATVMALAPADAPAARKEGPNMIYASGIANYLAMFGLPYKVGLGFALLAFSTFVYDTLDVCTRLARYILQELLAWKGLVGGFVATAATLAAPLAFLLLIQREQAWRVAWNIFGASNQLLASLTLMAVAIWLLHTGRRAVFVLVPMALMMVMALWSLVTQAWPFWAGLAGRGDLVTDTVIVGVAGTLLLVLAVWLIAEASRSVLGGGRLAPPGAKAANIAQPQ
ncbi:MAG: carbon starvation protein A [Planctomycetes bacterium]|nr:carbon starvation protein A [Planctomycetota bacterium]